MYKQSEKEHPPPVRTETNIRAVFSPAALKQCALRFRESCYLLQDTDNRQIGAVVGNARKNVSSQDLLTLGFLPPLFPEWLGDRSFSEYHKVRFPYIAGEMAQGIASTEFVIALARANILAFFGAGGMDIHDIETGVKQLSDSLTQHNISWGVNLIHSPQEPYLEQQAVDCFLKYGVQTVSASAFMRMEESIIRYACSGLHIDVSGNIIRPHRILAKVSRPEVAAQFMKPAPQALLQKLVSNGVLNQTEAELAARIPVAEDITAEADSGGHTDNRPLGSLLPTLLILRDKIVQQYNYDRPIRVGAAGGIGTPSAVAAAFSMGAAFVVTGSINQACSEAGQSLLVKQMLSQQSIADVAMAPAADMFEIGAKLQVAKRGTLFAQRASQLYEIYQQYDSVTAIPLKQRLNIEKNIFREPLDTIWKETKTFWGKRHPLTLKRANVDPKFKMALIFRWYLGKSSYWARAGISERQTDFQIWCGPSMGAFNEWCKDSFLEHAENRSVVQVAYNLMEGASAITRAHQMRSYGAPMPPDSFNYKPRLFSSSLL